MSKVEIKEEINKIIDGLPDDLLNDLLLYLQEVEKNHLLPQTLLLTSGRF